MTRTWRLACTDSGDGSPAVAAALVAELRDLAARRGVALWCHGEWLFASGPPGAVTDLALVLEGEIEGGGGTVSDRPRGEG